MSTISNLSSGQLVHIGSFLDYADLDSFTSILARNRTILERTLGVESSIEDTTTFYTTRSVSEYTNAAHIFERLDNFIIKGRQFQACELIKFSDLNKLSSDELFNCLQHAFDLNQNRVVRALIIKLKETLNLHREKDYFQLLQTAAMVGDCELIAQLTSPSNPHFIAISNEQINDIFKLAFKDLDMHPQKADAVIILMNASRATHFSRETLSQLFNEGVRAQNLEILHLFEKKSPSGLIDRDFIVNGVLLCSELGFSRFLTALASNGGFRLINREEYITALQKSIEFGHLDVIKTLLDTPLSQSLLIPDFLNIIEFAYENDQEEAVLELFQHPIMNPFWDEIDIGALLTQACENGSYQIAKWIIDSPLFHAVDENSLKIAFTESSYSYPLFLLLFHSSKRTEITADMLEETFVIAARIGHIHIMTLLINDERFAQFKNDRLEAAVLEAAIHNQVAIVRMLMSSSKKEEITKKAIFDALSRCAEKELVQPFSELLSYVDPEDLAKDDRWKDLLFYAGENDLSSILKAYINSALYNKDHAGLLGYALQGACKTGNYKSLKSIITSPQFADISQEDLEYSFNWAIDGKYNAIIRLFLISSREAEISHSAKGYALVQLCQLKKPPFPLIEKLTDTPNFYYLPATAILASLKAADKNDNQKLGKFLLERITLSINSHYNSWILHPATITPYLIYGINFLHLELVCAILSDSRMDEFWIKDLEKILSFAIKKNSKSMMESILHSSIGRHIKPELMDHLIKASLENDYYHSWEGLIEFLND